MYDLMMKSTGLEYQSLANYANIARAFPEDVREYVYDSVLHLNVNSNTKLSFAHFQILAPLTGKNLEQATNFLIKAGKEES